MPATISELDVAEVVLEVAVARTEAVADAHEGERPDGGADERQAEEQREWHLEQPRRNGDEGADDGCHRPEQDSRPAPAPEPDIGPVEPLSRHVEPAAVTLEKLATSPASDQPADEAPQEVADGGREHDREVGAGPRADVGAEHRDAARPRQDAGGDRASHERDQLAPDGQERTEREQAEDGVDAVIRDRGGKTRRDAREEHSGESSDACERAMRTAPRASSCRRSSSPARPPGSGRRMPGARRSVLATPPAPGRPAAVPSGASPPARRSDAGPARRRSPGASAGTSPSGARLRRS